MSSWIAIVSATYAGGVHNDVERSLREDLKYSKDDIDAIRSSTSVEKIYLCQSALASTGSCRSGWQRESARPARLPGLPHHDFAVLHLTATNSEGELLEFFISAEKEGRGQGGGTPGIYIHLLTGSAFQELCDNHNIIFSWKGYSIQVPLGDLTTTLEGHDTNYNLILNNCWRYAKAACRSVILLLSQQPGVNPEQKQLLLKSSTRQLSAKSARDSRSKTRELSPDNGSTPEPRFHPSSNNLLVNKKLMQPIEFKPSHEENCQLHSSQTRSKALLFHIVDTEERGIYHSLRNSFHHQGGFSTTLLTV